MDENRLDAVLTKLAAERKHEEEERLAQELMGFLAAISKPAK